MDIKDIDEHLSASGVLKLIEIKKAQSKAKLPNLLRSDGTAKKEMQLQYRRLHNL